MKKYLLTMLLVLVGCMTAMAGDVINLSDDPVRETESANLVLKHQAIEGSDEIVKGKSYILVSDGTGQTLNMEVLSVSDLTLSVSKSRNGEKYDYARIVIPDSVISKDKTYTVCAIGANAFNGEDKLTSVRFPNTIKYIYDKAFYKCGNLESLSLPEGLEFVGKQSFSLCGNGGLLKDVEEMHSLCTLLIPSSVNEMDKLAFMFYGTMTSKLGQFQGIVESLPTFITEKNCSKYYISKESYKKYQLAKEKLTGNNPPIEVTSLAQLKSCSGSVFIEIEYKNATYDNQKNLEAEYPGVKQLIIDSTRELSAYFNKASKNWFIVHDRADADIIVRINLTNVDRYFNPTSFGKSGFVTNLWGKATLLNSRGNQVGEYHFNELSGLGQNGFRPSTGQSFINSMDKLGETLGNFFNEGK